MPGGAHPLGEGVSSDGAVVPYNANGWMYHQQDVAQVG